MPRPRWVWSGRGSGAQPAGSAGRSPRERARAHTWSSLWTASPLLQEPACLRCYVSGVASQVAHAGGPGGGGGVLAEARCARARAITTPRPRAWFPGPRGGRRERGLSRREGPRVTFLRKICRSGPQPRPESSDSAALSHGLQPPAPLLGPWRGDPPPTKLKPCPGLSFRGSQGESDPPPPPDSVTSTWKEALALFALWERCLLFGSQAPPRHGVGAGRGWGVVHADGCGNPREHRGGASSPPMSPFPIFPMGSPSTSIW